MTLTREWATQLPEYLKQGLDSDKKINDLIWKTWKQECYWCGRQPGRRHNYEKTISKLRHTYGAANAEYFIRSQFCMKREYGLNVAGPINFTHLAGAGCDKVFTEYFNYCEQHADMRVLQIAEQVKDWELELERVNAGEPSSYYSTDDSIVKCIICDRLGTPVPKIHLHFAAVECIHWPDIITKIGLPLNLVSEISVYQQQVH